jgi:myosin-1
MKCRPSYIRTIKPNQNRSGTEFDDKAVLHQIKYLGLQENIRVRRAGFAYRNTFEKIVERFYLLSPATSYAGDYIWQGTSKSGCEQILKDTGIAKEEWQMGVTKAFIKSPETVMTFILIDLTCLTPSVQLFALETMRDRYWHNMAGRIQRAFRNYLRYKNECARRIQRFWKNNKESIEYARRRDRGHEVLANRKERRRFSLLGYRRFMGDYLDVKGSAFGEELASICGIGCEPLLDVDGEASSYIGNLSGTGSIQRPCTTSSIKARPFKQTSATISHCRTWRCRHGISVPYFHTL